MLSTLATVLSLSLSLPSALGHDNGLALTPQMGWNTWNYFGCDVSEDTIVSAAKAMIQYDLPKYGYECKLKRMYSCSSVTLICLFCRCHFG